MRLWTVLILMALLGGMSLAQDTAEADKTRPAGEETTRRPTEERRETLRERIRRAMRLPRTTEEARQEGAAEEDVQEVLRTGRERGVPAGDMEEILAAENEELRAGRKDNFGAAVGEMKASGLRGRELADAIHAEQVARGMKKPKHKGKGGRADSHADERSDAYGGRERQADEALEKTTGRADPRTKSKGQGKGKNKGKGR